MTDYPDDIHTEQDDIDVNTLANLGPLTRLAGIWEGTKGLDVNPNVDGSGRQAFLERIELQPTDPQSNGPQLFYGLRYHLTAKKPGLPETYHDQVGYWLWEPATGLILHSLTIPRGQTALAAGHAAPGADSFEVRARRGATDYGICSTAFLEHAFRTDSFTLKVTFHADGGWSYVSDTVLQVRGQDAPFHHTDRNTLTKVAEPTPNPLALAAAAEA